MKQFKILVIDDEKLIRWSFEKHLNGQGYKVFSAETGEEGLKLFEEHNPDVVFLDNKLPKMQGLDVIPKIKALDKDAIIVFITAHGSIETAVKAIKLGAFEFVNKPFTFEEINVVLDNIKDKINISTEIQLLKRQQKEDITFDSIIGRSKEMKEIIQIADKITKTETTTILLLGESGTGKDIIAKAIHNESSRKSKPFVTINCSSFSDTLLESEIFGHEKGSFTDAKAMKKGLFEIAEGGTVFLDEIGEVNLSTQVKLLGVLENRNVRRVGGVVDIPVDIRIIAATNKDLKKSIEEKSFREDLYYRLKVFQINIPPLREHKDDIHDLIMYFISQFNNQFRKSIKGIEPDAENILLQYNWPGNIRELRNVIERAVILESNNNLHVESFPGEIRNINKPTEELSSPYEFQIPDDGISLEELEKQIIIKAMQKANNNQTLASQLIGISRDTLRYKLKKHSI